MIFTQTAPAGTLSRHRTHPDDQRDALALIYFHGEFWHSDDEKAAEYAAASDYPKEFIAKCAEVPTMHGVRSCGPCTPG